MTRPEGSKNDPWSTGVLSGFLRTAATDLEIPLTLDPSEVPMYRMIAFHKKKVEIDLLQQTSSKLLESLAWMWKNTSR
ncbi:uncharacterized protein FFB14_15245 [Fusarium fujikuroi]|nr:uncharacterized protein FFB14_15245 [Fusarium fujikuroi]